MALMGAMFASSSALNIFGQSMGVIGNNLANTNTVGFKASRAAFQDVLAQSVGYTEAEGTNQVGNGVNVGAISPILEQGTFEQTSMPTDLGIDGQGYFVVMDYSEIYEGAPFYTRAGDFKRDVDGRLVTNGGMVLQGIPFNAEGIPTGSPTDIYLEDQLNSAINPTSVANVSVNLNSLAADFSDPSALAYDPANPETYNYSTHVRVYDSLGAGHNVELQFRKMGDNRWQWFPVVDTDELNAANQGTDTVTCVTDVAVDGTLDVAEGRVNDIAAGATYTNGELQFTSSGFLRYEGSTPITFNWSNGSAAQQIMFNFGNASDASGDATNDFGNQDVDRSSATYLYYDAVGTLVADTNTSTTTGSVQFATGFATMNVNQDGFPPGSLERISISPSGVITGSYTNGADKSLYQIVLANFTNESGLEQVGSNLFNETFKSGQPVVGTPLTDRFGSVLSNSLEQSNVDISQEVIRMIGTQRAFQANSRIVSVVDGMLEEMVNLKR
ncbi:MAG: flagellar hook protein FlgE [Magnetococcales bacterium]|nr:flagellar hook protein FlgE [Magnetococcales bacterium]